MDKNCAGVITFYEIAELLNDNLKKEGYSVFSENETITYSIMEDLSRYFKTLQNVDFDENKFKELCLK